MITIFFLIAIVQSRVAVNYSCEDHPMLKNLVISTGLSIIFENCKINNNWMIKNFSLPMCEHSQRVFEGEENIRRPIKFYLKPSTPSSSKTEKIKIKNIKLNYPDNIASTTISMNTFTLTSNENIDVYLDYNCLSTKSKALPSDWYKIKVEIEVESYQSNISFEFYKICSASFSKALDVSHFILIIVTFGIIYISFFDKFDSTLEEKIVKNYNEMRNPENLTIITIVVAILLFMLYVVDLISEWINICLFFTIIITIGMLCEGGYKFFNKQSTLSDSEKGFTIPYIGHLTNELLICFGVSIVLFLIWCLSHNWLICDIIVIGVSVGIIRLIKFTSFKFLVSIYVIGLVYDLFWVINYSSYFTESSKLTNNASHHFPLRLLCPQMVSTPFNFCNSLPIADIILPGLFLGYIKKFDEVYKSSSKMQMSYFLVGIIAIGVGFVVNLIVFYMYMLPIPSFLCTGLFLFIGTLGYAGNNGQIAELFGGFKSTEYGDVLTLNMSRIIKENKKESEQFYLNKEEYKPLSNQTNNDSPNKIEMTEFQNN